MVQLCLTADNLYVFCFPIEYHRTKAHYTDGAWGSSWSKPRISSFHADSLSCGRSMSMITYIRRSIIASPGVSEWSTSWSGSFSGSDDLLLPSDCTFLQLQQGALWCHCRSLYCLIIHQGQILLLANPAKSTLKLPSTLKGNSVIMQWAVFIWLKMSLDQNSALCHYFRHLTNAMILRGR